MNWTSMLLTTEVEMYRTEVILLLFFVLNVAPSAAHCCLERVTYEL